MSALGYAADAEDHDEIMALRAENAQLRKRLALATGHRSWDVVEQSVSVHESETSRHRSLTRARRWSSLLAQTPVLLAQCAVIATVWAAIIGLAAFVFWSACSIIK